MVSNAFTSEGYSWMWGWFWGRSGSTNDLFWNIQTSSGPTLCYLILTLFKDIPSTHTCICMYIDTHTSIYICICVWFYVCAYLFDMCTCASTHVYRCINKHTCVRPIMYLKQIVCSLEVYWHPWSLGSDYLQFVLHAVEASCASTHGHEHGHDHVCL